MIDFYLLDITELPDPKSDRTALFGIQGWRCAHILKYLRARQKAIL